MKILVLGGTGAIGVDLVDILGRRGDDFYVTSRSERKSDNNNVHYIKGNAHGSSFLAEILKERYDVIVDFMFYSTTDFLARADILLHLADQYCIFSSARVYADSYRPITEDSPGLLDVCIDKQYLATNEYALAKARQEDILKHNPKKTGLLYAHISPTAISVCIQLHLIVTCSIN